MRAPTSCASIPDRQSPVGHPARLRTYLDRALAAYDPIWAAAGHSHAVFNTSYEQLRDLTGAIEIDVD